MNKKIFGIGLSKTGTASLASALNIDAVHWDYTQDTIEYIDSSLYICPEKFKSHDAFTDTPIARIYKKLDKLFPHSKFIYTYRDQDDWINSCKKFFYLNLTKNQLKNRYERTSKRDSLMIDLYNSIEFNREKFINAYKNHEKEIFKHFKNRKNDLLSINICSSSSKGNWQKICKFLGKKIPQEDFPKKNVKNYSNLNI